MNIIVNCANAAGPVPIVQTTTLTASLSSAPISATHSITVALPPSNSAATGTPLHRLGAVRRREQISRHKVGQVLGISTNEVARQECPSSDMSISNLRRWQQALGVPIAELLDDTDGDLSPPVQLRARLLRIMKTVRSIQGRTRQVSVQRLTTMLAEQLLEVMPELKDTGAWPTVGQQRAEKEVGQAYFRRLTVEPLDDFDGSDG
jgi:transcriptional regulator with XRE-family HTH domain